MEKLGVELRINMRDIDMSRVYNGSKGDYLTLTAFISPKEPSNWGDHGGIQYSLSKEERDAGLKLPFVGNAKVYWTDDNSHVKGEGGGGQQQAPQQQNKSASNFDDFDDEVPF